jgi:PUA-domain protein
MAMPVKFRRYFLKAKEARDLLDNASRKLKIDFERVFGGKVNVELVEAESAQFILFNGRPALARVGDKTVPTLVFDEFVAVAPKVVVDMGAVPHVCNGANVMAPGIVKYEGEFGRGDFVVVVDVKYGKPLAVGQALYDVNEARGVKQGVVVNNVHFVGDRLWVFLKQMQKEFRER